MVVFCLEEDDVEKNGRMPKQPLALLKLTYWYTLFCSLGPTLAEVNVNIFLDLDLVFFKMKYIFILKILYPKEIRML